MGAFGAGSKREPLLASWRRGTSGGHVTRLSVGNSFASRKSSASYLLHLSIGSTLLLLATTLAQDLLAASGISAFSLGLFFQGPNGPSRDAAVQAAQAADEILSYSADGLAEKLQQAGARPAAVQLTEASLPEPRGVPAAHQKPQGTTLAGGSAAGTSQEAGPRTEGVLGRGGTILQVIATARGADATPVQARHAEGSEAAVSTVAKTGALSVGVEQAAAGTSGEDGGAEQGQQQAGSGEDAGPDLTRPSKCPARCSEHGTCNEETGECHCLVQYAGNDCSELAMPSCHLAPGYWTPCALVTTCECAKECHKYRFPTSGTCLRGTDSEGKKLTNLDEIFSGTQYFLPRGEDDVIAPMDYSGSAEASPSMLTSPSSCPFNCSGHGVCEKESKVCRCPWAAQGTGCEKETLGLPVPCVNGCSDKGQCVLGTCRCDRGYFGADCSLFIDKAGTTRILSRLPYSWTTMPWPTPKDDTPLRPRIYVYDLPGQYNTWQAYHSNRLDWQEPIWFMERVLNSPYRTANPDEADFFYIPLWIRNRFSMRASLVEWAKKYVWENFPYWRKYGGMRHFVLTNSDWGNCELLSGVGEMHRSVKDLFTVTLWGMKLSMHMQKKGRCFREGIDIVMPPDQDRIIFKFAPGFAKQLQEPIQERTILLYFRGFSADDQPLFGRGGYEWSFGVRQEMFRRYRGRYKETGILLDTMENEPADNWHLRQMMRSLFCLAPAGWGWGMRTTQAILMGCIPVVIQPNVAQPFEGDGLDWSEFAVQFGKEDIPNLEKILRAIPSEAIAKKRDAMERVKRKFIWSSTNYSPFQLLSQEERDELAPKILMQDAFEGIMESLRLRLKRQGNL